MWLHGMVLARCMQAVLALQTGTPADILIKWLRERGASGHTTDVQASQQAYGASTAARASFGQDYVDYRGSRCVSAGTN